MQPIFLCVCTRAHFARELLFFYVSNPPSPFNLLQVLLLMNPVSLFSLYNESLSQSPGTWMELKSQEFPNKWPMATSQGQPAPIRACPHESRGKWPLLLTPQCLFYFLF